MRNVFVFNLVLLQLFFFLFGCERSRKSEFPNKVMVASVSSDGRFATTSHVKNSFFLWDLTNKNESLISKEANIYSAYFVEGSSKFLWQDLNNIVYIQDLNGRVSQSFWNEPVYGHLITSDFQKYFSSDMSWAIHAKINDEPFVLVKAGDRKSFLGFGKLLNLDLSSDNRTLLMCGYGYDHEEKYSLEDEKREKYRDIVGTVLWDTNSLDPLFKIDAHNAKITAILSPDGKYIISGSENGIGRVWGTAEGAKRLELASLYHGLWTGDDGGDPGKWYDKTGLIPPPEDLNGEDILAFRFIDMNGHYLRFGYNSPYAVLYHIDNPLPLKYLPLGRDPFPAVSDYSRNAAIDTAPEAGILVMGQRDGGGIIVYRFDAEKLELQKVWVGDVPEDGVVDGGKKRDRF